MLSHAFFSTPYMCMLQFRSSEGRRWYRDPPSHLSEGRRWERQALPPLFPGMGQLTPIGRLLAFPDLYTSSIFICRIVLFTFTENRVPLVRAGAALGVP